VHFPDDLYTETLELNVRIPPATPPTAWQRAVQASQRTLAMETEERAEAPRFLAPFSTAPFKFVRCHFTHAEKLAALDLLPNCLAQEIAVSEELLAERNRSEIWADLPPARQTRIDLPYRFRILEHLHTRARKKKHFVNWQIPGAVTHTYAPAAATGMRKQPRRLPELPQAARRSVSSRKLPALPPGKTRTTLKLDKGGKSGKSKVTQLTLSNQKMWDVRRVNDQVRGANLGEKTEVGIDSEHVDREQKAQVMAWEVKRVNPQVHIPVVCYPCLCSSKTPCSICTETGACDLILFLF
jgi:hypothetical protein